MPKLSDRGLLMPASPIRKLVPYAEAAKEKGRKVYHLNIGQPDIASPTVAFDAIKNIQAPLIPYSHSAGNESYRKKLADHYHQIGIDVDYNQILIATGGSEALLFTMLACFNPGDEIIIPEPFYANYNGFALAAGLKIRPITSTIEQDFALPDIDNFERLINNKTRAILICNPNNPTGYSYSKAELEKLRGIVLKYDLYLMVDEVYREFCYTDKGHYSVLQLKGLEQHALMFDSISKQYSACGVRIGNLTTRNQAVLDAVLKLGQARLSPPGFGQIFAEAALDTPPEYFQAVYDEYIARRDFVVNALNAIEGVLTPTPRGAFYTIVRLPIDNSERFCQWLLESFEHNNATVMLAPASGFYATPELGKQEVRLAYVLNINDLKKSVACLREALKVYPGRLT